MAREKINIVNIDRFKPKLYADLYVPSWVNGYSIGMEYIHNWFLSKFKPGYFRTVHIVGKHPFDDFRRFEYGDYAKREKPAVSFGSSIQYDFDSDNVDIHMLGIDGYLKRTNYQRSFFKDPERYMYLGMVLEVMMINFSIRVRVETRAEQIDMYKRMELLFRIGCTETIDTDMDFHVPYDLMYAMARDAGFEVSENKISEPYKFLKYLNKYSQVPFLYKFRYINGRPEYFIRMTNLAVYLDTRNRPDPDDGEVEGQTSNNYHIDFPISLRLPVPKFYAYYAEGKLSDNVYLSDIQDTNIYSMRVFDIPEINKKGWVQYGTANYVKEPEEEHVKEIDIKEIFTTPVDNRVDVSLDDLITDSIESGVSPSAFIDIALYTNDMMIDNGRVPITINWKDRKIILPDKIINSYFYIIIYTDQGYINSRIIDINGVYKNRVTNSKKTMIDKSEDCITYEPTVEK